KADPARARNPQKELAMTAVADTRLLLTLQFPPTKELKARIEETITRELAGRLIAPSVMSTEFLKIAGARIGESAAELRLNLLKERGMKVIPITEEMALTRSEERRVGKEGRSAERGA